MFYLNFACKSYKGSKLHAKMWTFSRSIELKCKILRLVWGVGFSMLYLIAFTYLELPNVWLQAVVLDWIKLHLWMKSDFHVHECLLTIMVRNPILLFFKYITGTIW